MNNGIIKITSNDFLLNIDTNEDEDEDENDEYLQEEYEYVDNIVADPDYIPEKDDSENNYESSESESDYSEDFTDDEKII